VEQNNGERDTKEKKKQVEKAQDTNDAADTAARRKVPRSVC